MTSVPFTSRESLAGSRPRQAALLAHAMSAHDREWLLGQLEPEERARLEAMLQELRSLGVPPDPALVREVLDAKDATPMGATIALEDRRHSAIPGLPVVPAGVLHALLEKEPDALVARVLAQVPDRLQSAVLRRFPASRRAALEHIGSQPTGKVPSACRLDKEIEARLLARAGDPVTGLSAAQRLSASLQALHRQVQRVLAARGVPGGTTP